jgi:hypothetical protein
MSIEKTRQDKLAKVVACLLSTGFYLVRGLGAEVLGPRGAGLGARAGLVARTGPLGVPRPKRLPVSGVAA